MHRRARQREQQGVEQLDLAPVITQQRRETAANAEIEPRLGIVGVDFVHIVAVFVGHHFEGQLVVIAQKQRPLAVVGDRRRLLEDVDDRETILHVHRHKNPRHDRESERPCGIRRRRRNK